MSRHQYDLVQCLNLPGVLTGKLCDKCDGRCPLCDSDVRLISRVRICDSCAFGNNGNKCIVCGNAGNHEALYCSECCKLETSRDGCPRVLNIGSNRMDGQYKSEKKVTTEQ